MVSIAVNKDGKTVVSNYGLKRNLQWNKWVEDTEDENDETSRHTILPDHMAYTLTGIIMSWEDEPMIMP